MAKNDKDLRRIIQIGNSKGITLLKALESTEFPTELGALLEVQIKYEDDGPFLKVTPYKPIVRGNARGSARAN